MLVVLNDNCMSIDPNVGALKEYLTDITTSHTYNKVKDEVWNLLGKISKFGPNAQAIVQKVENAVKSALLKQSNLFESLKFRYFGPVDGHDVERLVKVLRDLKDIPGPKILHTITVKGKGYGPPRRAAPPCGMRRASSTRRPARSSRWCPRARSRPSTRMSSGTPSWNWPRRTRRSWASRPPCPAAARSTS
jgi:deoxyxylulose-5-phosphate synthase